MKLKLQIVNPPTGACREYAKDQDIPITQHIHHRFLRAVEEPTRFRYDLLLPELARLWGLGNLPPDRFVIPDWEEWPTFDGPFGCEDRDEIIAGYEQVMHFLAAVQPNNPRSVWGLPRVYEGQTIEQSICNNRGCERLFGLMSFGSPALYLRGPFVETADVVNFRDRVSRLFEVCGHFNITPIPQLTHRFIMGGEHDLAVVPDETLEAVRNTLEMQRVGEAVLWCQDADMRNTLNLTNKEVADQWVNAVEILTRENE